jgi:AraC family transcriptional regulator, activator of mtrCDE
MDALNQVIQLTRLQGSLDLRCYLAGRFAIDHEAEPPGEAPFHLVLAGRCLLELNPGTTLTLNTGDMVVLPRGHAHVIRDIGAHTVVGTLRMERDGPLPVRRNTYGDAELDLLCGRFRYVPTAAGLLMRALPEALHVSLADNTELEQLRGLIALFRAEVQQLQPGALTIVNALSQALFVLALRAYMQRHATPPSLLALLIDPRLGRSVQAMLRQPEKAWSVASLAECAAMSRATFARAFQAVAHMSPWELLTLLRMHIAADLLTEGSMGSASIAERVGYQSDAAFAKAFRRHAGTTPAQFRRQHRGL